MVKNPSTRDEYRRQELAGLLRTRRARISLDDTGLPVVAGSRRRTPGLRREEVAQLAGISASLYTWLEQGRILKTSRRVVDGIARVLKLDKTERSLLVELAMGGAGEAESHAGAIDSWMYVLLESMDDVPAYITNSRWDIVAWNAAARAIIIDFEALPPEERNALWLMLTSKRFRTDLGENWERMAQAVTARFRLDYARHASAPRFVELVQKLTERSAEFAQWWTRHDLQQPTVRETHRIHPQLGELVLGHVYLEFRHEPEFTLTVFPSDAATRSRIRKAADALTSGPSSKVPRLVASNGRWKHKAVK